jgi:hypothetical protein
MEVSQHSKYFCQFCGKVRSQQQQLQVLVVEEQAEVEEQAVLSSRMLVFLRP